MKKTLQEEKQRILQIMSQIDKSFLLTELNEKYLNQLLDKVSKSGIKSLTSNEKRDLETFSMGNDAKSIENTLDVTSHRLRFTAAKDATVLPKDLGKLYGRKKHTLSFIDGDAEELAGNDIPIFLDGDMGQLDKPQEEQEILMIIPSGEYVCISIITEEPEISDMVYYLRLKHKHSDELKEGNAFAGAVAKAKKEGKDTFEIDGKTYNVKK